MDAPENSGYQPKALRAEDLRTPLTSNLRRLPPALRDELHASRAALVERLHPWGPTRREERKRSVLAGLILLPLAGVLLTPLSGPAILVLMPLGALYGLALTELQPRSLLSGLGLVGVIALAHVLTGTPLLIPPGSSGLAAGLYFLFAICRLLFLLCVGMMMMAGRRYVGE